MSDQSLPIILFGHRGAKGEAPENTLVGFDYSWFAGIRAFELDIQISKDEKLVIIHDPYVDRTTDSTGQVGDFTSDELHSLNANQNFPGVPNYNGVPLLEQVLEKYVNRILDWQIEIKTNSPSILQVVCEKLVFIIDDFQISKKVTVTSFDPIALRTVRAISSEQRIGLIQPPDSIPGFDLALGLGCSDICVPLNLCTSSYVHEAHLSGLRVTGWLGNSAYDISKLINCGVDAITTDFPSIAMSFLRWYLR